MSTAIHQSISVRRAAPAATCLACESPRFSRWFSKKSLDDGRCYSIHKCHVCESAFVTPRPDVEYLEEYYAGTKPSHARTLVSITEAERYESVLQEEHEYPNSSLDAARMTDRCKVLAHGNRFLDIGAGYGFFSKAASERGFRVTAIEPTEMCREVFRRMNDFEAVPGMLNSEFVRANKGSFDVVLMSQVLEHIGDLAETVGRLADVLAPKGIVALAVPHFGSWLSGLQGKSDMFIIPPEHLNFFSLPGLVALFARHQMKCLDAQTVSRFNANRIAKRTRIPFVGRCVSRVLLTGLRCSDRFHRGMFINAYFQKA